MSQKRPQHDRSKHLKDNENNYLIQLIEKEDGVTLATAAIQLWLSQKPNHITWNKNVTGIICFVKDYAKKSYFFRLYSLTSSNQLWEQEMYTPFSYNQLTKNFHYFASDVCNAGFNFAFEDEAEKFYNTVNNKIMTKTKRSGKAVLPQTRNNNYSIVPTANHTQISSSTSNLPNYSTNITLNAQHSTTSLNSRNSDTKLDKNVKKGKKTGIDKSMISGPTGFRVVQHVGLNNNSFEINLQQDEQSKKMKEFLSELNLDSIPVSKKTKAFVESYVKDHGGLDRFSEELKKQKAPAPTQSAPTIPSQFNTNNNFGNNNRQLPPPQVNNQQQQQVRQPPINRGQNIPPSVPPPPPPPLLPPQPQYAATSQVFAPPPLPPPLPASKPTNLDNNRQFLTNDNSPLPQPRFKDENNASNESTPVAAGPPAPPPPPPPPPPPLAMFQATSTPPAAPVLNTTPTINVSKILNGSPSPINSSTNDSRNNLLDSIKGFSGFSKTLTPPAQTQTNRNSDIPSQQLDNSSIVDQLKNELLKRAQFLNDSSDGDDDESDSEWQ